MKLDRDIDSPARSHDGQPSRRRVLFVCHNHWALLAGGVESYVAGVYDTFRDSPEFEPFVLARAGQPYSRTDSQHSDAPLAMVGRDPNQYLLYTDFSKFDYEFGRLSDKSVLTRSFADFLLALQPDVVHFQHTLYMGYDMVRVITKHALPDDADRLLAARVHADLPSRRPDGPHHATKSSARRSRRGAATNASRTSAPQTFYMRKRFIQSHLSLVDHFMAPSDYVRERYVDWGIPAEQDPGGAAGLMPVTDRRARGAGRAPAQPLRLLRPAQSLQGRGRLLEAMDDPRRRLRRPPVIYGANLDKQGAGVPEAVRARCSRRDREQRHVRRPLRPRRDLRAADGRHRLGGGALDLVGDRADGRDGGVPVRAAR